MKKLYRFMAIAFAMTIMFCLLGNADVSAATKKTPAKPKITVKVTGNEITVTINKTKNAEGYEIYVKNPDSSKYEKAATVKENGTAKRTYTLSDIPKGTYKIKVRAYNGSKYSKYSAVKTAKVEKEIVEYVKTHDFGPNDQEYMITDPFASFIEKGGCIRVARTAGEYLDGGTVEGWLHANNVVLGDLNK